MRHVNILLTLISLFIIVPVSLNAQGKYNDPPLKNDICDKIIMGDFTCEKCTSADELLAQDYRDEVSSVLTKYHYCTVIDRDRLADVLKKNQNEAFISSIDQLSATERTELTNIAKAKRILFGTLKYQVDNSLLVTLDITNLETSRSELKHKIEIPKEAVLIFSKRQTYIEKGIEELLLGKQTDPEKNTAVSPEQPQDKPPVDDYPVVINDEQNKPAVPPAPEEKSFVILGAIRDKWMSLGGKNSALGNVTADEKTTPDGIGRFNDFEKGAIYWTPGTGAHAIMGEIRDKWAALKWETGPLGYPTSDFAPTIDGIGRCVHFEHGSIYWSPKTGAHAVLNPIRDKWAILGWAAGRLGYPTTDFAPTLNGIGRFVHFEHGSIYWSPKTGAFAVLSAIRDKWASLGWELGLTGFPISDELPTPDGIGRFNLFERASIYWSPKTGAHEVHGVIRDKWGTLGWEKGLLGYPVTDETPTPDKIGRFNHFEYGSIYWTPQTGAFEVHGAIRDLWAKLGWERSKLGYPKSDERPSAKCPGCRESVFQNGIIYLSAARGAWIE